MYLCDSTLWKLTVYKMIDGPILDLPPPVPSPPSSVSVPRHEAVVWLFWIVFLFWNKAASLRKASALNQLLFLSNNDDILIARKFKALGDKTEWALVVLNILEHFTIGRSSIAAATYLAWILNLVSGD
ncbi:unnamed protein product [Microthlaspi erraticum]|uniref:Uncharacterized protein n=1 Tax=Microthlaspi erraticum TaxID=1685480 RepID=A0A6D2JBW5_9BRAS|nr:unnamed protein product [Microthlaspi erraticum]